MLAVAAACSFAVPGRGSAVAATPPGDDADGDGVPDTADAYPDNPDHAQLLTVTIECSHAGAPDPEFGMWFDGFVIDRVALDFSEPWATLFPPDVRCDVTAINGQQARDLVKPVTALEFANWEATDPRYREFTLSSVFHQCVEHATTWTTQEWPLSREQAFEALEAFAFCPDHPDRAAIEERMAEFGVG
jgi:hypothetical protein